MHAMSSRLLLHRTVRLLTEHAGKATTTTTTSVAVNSPRRYNSSIDASSSEENTSSSKKTFQALPVHSSILHYIETVGVGIPKRKSKARRVRERRADVMGPQQEKEFFDSSRRRRRTSSTAAGASQKPTRTPKKNMVVMQDQPPLPFGIPRAVGGNDGDESKTKIRRKPVKVVRRVGSVHEKLPENLKIPEIALAGRSNVGKSSLLNALVYGSPLFVDTGGRGSSSRRQLPKLPRGIKAATSPTPGETKQISFYQLSPPKELAVKDLVQSLWLVDLPGYGFAFDGKAEEWQECTRQYLLTRGKMLKRILLLLDARHGMKAADIDFLTALERDLRYNNSSAVAAQEKQKIQLPPLQLVLTKCDLVSQVDLARRVVQVERQLSECLRRQTSNLPVLLVSVKLEHRGVLELQKELAALVPSETSKYKGKDKKY